MTDEQSKTLRDFNLLVDDAANAAADVARAEAELDRLKRRAQQAAATVKDFFRAQLIAKERGE